MELIKEMWDDGWPGRLMLALLIFVVLLTSDTLYGRIPFLQPKAGSVR